MRYRFIGGIADGQLLTADPKRVKHCVPNPQREKPRPLPHIRVTKPETGVDTYIPIEFKDDNKRVHVLFMLAGMAPKEAVRQYRSYETDV